MKIFGAGIAGLLAGCTFQNARIYEAGSEGQAQHKALLRFRSSAVGDAVGVDFRKVLVHKGIWCDDKFVQPNIQMANLYSQKVIGRLANRSIWNIEPVDRFIAPEDFICQLAERCQGRIEWNTSVTQDDMRNNELAISTIPMSVMAKMMANPYTHPEFKFEQITVRRWRVHGADVFQTIYFPSPETTLYRASITGDLLIAECIGAADQFDFFPAFGLNDLGCEPIESVQQRFGKIAPIDDAWRKRFIFDLSHQHNIYSLGRFGTWRNILLDDVIKDIAVIKKLMNSGGYEHNRQCAT